MVDNDASRRKIGQRYAENSPPLLRHVDSSDENFGYGWGNIRPGSLHFMNHPICFLIVMMLLTTTQGTAILGIFTVVLPQIEKRFSLSSTDIGLIAAANDAAALILGLFISYYGDFANKIKWISLGGIISGVGFILFTFPHFIAGKYNPPATLNVGLAMCVVSNGTSSPQDQCPEGAAVQWYYMAIFCITQFIAGAGTLPLYSLTPAYIAENVSAKRTPIYMGFWYLSTFLGPLLGFGLADPLSKLYVDIDQPEGVNLTPKDPRWIGNWWAGFLGCGFFMILFSLVLLGFPKHLVPKEKEERKKDINIEVEKSNPHIASLRKRIKKTMVDFIASSKELMTNVTFLCNCMAMNITMFVQEGIAPFIAKTLFLKYGVGIGNLGKSLVICTTPGMIIGSLLGAFIVSKLNLKKSCKKSAFICFIFQILCLTGPLSFLIPGCANPNLAGLSVEYSKRVLVEGKVSLQPYPKSAAFLQSSCNDNCGCSLQTAVPLCGSDNISYIGPCHAGCTGITSLKPLAFANCSCIPSSNPYGGTAQIGFCDLRCKNWLLFLGMMGLMSFFVFMQLVPNRIVVLRCVPENKQAFAFGIQYISMKILANIPGPLVMGKIVDRSCEVWQNICGKQGNCFVYDVYKMSEIIVQGLATSFAIAIILYFIAWLFCKNEGTENTSDTENQCEKILEDEDEKETRL